MSAQSPPTQRDHIFISYRRDDASGASGRIYYWLRIGFGRERVFRDVASIGVGKWCEAIDGALAKSAACVAVIGPRWANPDNLPRLHDPDDMVRHELVSALACADITLVPTLVEGAPIPPLADLPAELRPLFGWNARTVSEGGWEDDIRRLIAEIAAATRLPVGPDLDTLLHNVAAARQRVAELEQARQHDAQQIENLRRPIDDLTARLADASAGERPALAKAFAELARGNTLAAEDAFEREYEAQGRLADQARRNQAEAARNVANLALLRDVTKAADFYRKALALEPERAETSLLLGYALIALGDLNQAQPMFAHSVSKARAASDLGVEMGAQIGQGDVLKRAGKLPDARRAYSAGLRSGRKLRRMAPGSIDAQRGLSLGYDRIGDVLLAQGKGPIALAAYRKGLAIREGLAASHADNWQWQRDVSVSLSSIAQVLLDQGDDQGALKACRRSQSVREMLCSRDPNNTRCQRDLLVSHNRIGDVLLAQEDCAGALTAYRTSLALAETLAARDAANREWQRDLSVGYEKIGDALFAQADRLIAERDRLAGFDAALKAYGKSIDIREGLTSHDPDNFDWKRDLSVSHMKIGDVLFAEKDLPAAYDAYSEGLAISEKLAASDHTNADWQRDLSLSYERIGIALRHQGNGPGALAAFRKAHAVREVQAARDPTNAQWQRDLMASYLLLSDAAKDGPLAAQGLRIAQRIQQRGILAPRDAWMIDELKRLAGK